MANSEHLSILKRGVKFWNDWRLGNQGARPDLAGANLSDAVLHRVNLSGIGLRGACFKKAQLNGSSFVSSDLEDVDFSEARLVGADFHEPDLDIEGTKIHRANLTNADLSNTDFRRSYLTNALLTNSWCHGTDFSGADLRDADFSNAHLFWTRFGAAASQIAYSPHLVDLCRTEFSESIMSHALFVQANLNKARGLTTIRHYGPSYIDIDTIVRSHGEIPEEFLRGVGLPEELIVGGVMTLLGRVDPIQFYSCFISFSSKDHEFADNLYSELQRSGVRCWYAPHDLRIGERFRQGIDQAIRIHDKLLLVLSSESVVSEWVEFEVEAALERESREGRPVLFPIRLDDAVMSTERAWAAGIRRTRHIGDFRQWKHYDQNRAAVDRLLRDLKAVDTPLP